MTDAESIAYLREWGLHDCWNPTMQEIVSQVCDAAERGTLTQEEQKKLEWLLEKSYGRPVMFLERLLTNGRTFVPREAFERLIHRYNEYRI